MPVLGPYHEGLALPNRFLNKKEKAETTGFLSGLKCSRMEPERENS
jgi:hypothetical protein